MSAITGTVKVWLSQYSTITQDELANGAPDLVGCLHYSNADLSSGGWTIVGQADITIRLADAKTIVENKVASLRAELATTKAEAYQKELRIESKIQSLLAIEFTPSEVDEPTPEAEPEDDEDGHCTTCAGTGEGRADGASCSACRGKGGFGKAWSRP